MSKSKRPQDAAFSALRDLLQGRGGGDTKIPYPFSFEQRPETDFEDRSMALIGGALIEQALEASILTHFTALDQNETNNLFSAELNAPLSSFANKIRLAYALEIIGKDARNDIKLVKAIRNTFAHAPDHIDFNTPKVSQACSQIAILDRINLDVFYKDKSNMKLRFKYSIILYYIALWKPGQPPVKYRNSADHGILR